MIRRFLKISGLLLTATVLAACGGVDSDESQPIVTEPDQGVFKATFNPAFGQAPFPNDIYFSGSTDATLNIPVAIESGATEAANDTDTQNSALTALNLLDGYSTTASIYVDTTDAINEATLAYGATVFLINTSTFGVVPATATHADFNGGSSTIEIVPAAPLDPDTTYAGFVTTNVESTVGANLSADAAFAGLQALYASGVTATDIATGAFTTGDATTDALYAQIYYGLFQLADGATIGASNLAVAWAFTTQSIGDSLQAVEASATAQANGFLPIPRNGTNYDNGIADTSDLNPALAGKADVYVGVMEVPYYSDAANPLSGYWTPDSTYCAAVVGADPDDQLSSQPLSTTGLCSVPAENATLRIPVLLTVPNATSDLGGALAGVAVFQHGITRNRTDMLAIADAMADAGRAVIAIDHPLHGLTDTANPLFASDANPLYQGAANASGDATLVSGITEPTFNLDVDGSAGIDGSGTYFINPASLLSTRDNLRQSAANLIHLVKTIPTIDYNAAIDFGASGADFAGMPIGFVGQSLGSITGTTFLAVNADAGPAMLSVPGGVLSQVIANSPSLSVPINAGLAAANPALVPGNRFYEEFLRNAQTVIDSGDPINYAAAANAGHPMAMHEVIGGASSDPDQVIPNAQTEALAAAAGLTAVGPGTYTGAEVDALVRFTAGSHGSLLDPTASVNTTVEMQTQMANFIGSDGTALPVGSFDPSVIDNP